MISTRQLYGAGRGPLGAEDQAKLKPFVARPTEPDSIFSAARGPVLAGMVPGPAKDVIGFDMTERPGGASVTLVLSLQDVDGPGWFISRQFRPTSTASMTVKDTPDVVTISVIAEDDLQSIAITVTCSTVTGRP